MIPIGEGTAAVAIPTLQPRPLCIYHKYCLDGFIAAWAVGDKFGFKNVDFLALDYGDPVPDIKGRVVYIVDFSFKPDVLCPVMGQASEIIMIDHHKSAIEEWEGKIMEAPGNFTFVFALSASGAVLTWKHLHEDSQAPYLFNIAQDHDLWDHKLHGTREMVTAMYSRGFVHRQAWAAFSRLVDAGEDVLKELYYEGQIVLQNNRTFLELLLSRGSKQYGVLGHQNVPVANVPYAFASQAGEMLNAVYPDAPFSMTYDDWHTKGVRVFSLRSRKEDGVDVSRIAKAMGGGGHHNAAGFKLPLHSNFSTFIEAL